MNCACDALVWACAKLNVIPEIATENTPSASVIDGIRYVNPSAGV